MLDLFMTVFVFGPFWIIGALTICLLWFVLINIGISLFREVKGGRRKSG